MTTRLRLGSLTLGLLLLVGPMVIGVLPASAEHATARWSGSGRVQTSLEVSRQTFASSSVAVLANQGAFADALAAGPMAGARGGPVLLSPADRLLPEVADELRRLAPDVVFLMGGRAALSDALRDQVAAEGFRVERISGPNRYATAAAAAVNAVEAWIDGGDGGAGRQVVIALGNHVEQSRAWPDALAAGVAAGLGHEPLLLIESSRVPIETRDAIADLGATSALIVGGTSAIPDATADMLGIPWTRISGADRYATAVALAKRAVANGASSADLTIVTGRAFPDALGAVPAAIARGSALLLVDGRDLARSSASQQWLESLQGKVGSVTVVGGGSAVSDAVVAQITDAVDGRQELTLALEEVVRADTALALRSDLSEPDVLYVAERAGRVLRVDVSGSTPKVSTFLDISSLVGTSGEQGLLDLILHPQFADNGRFYVHYSGASDGRTVLAEYRRRTSDPRIATTSGAVLYEVAQPRNNHNGGGLAFLPDGTLVMGLGDGGGANDTFGTGQDPNSALGSLLRFEVPSFGVARAPADNPYVDGPGVDEIWARGLRNPYRISVDGPSGTLWIADVGQDRFEEINAVAWNAGNVDYGWSTMEGPACFGAATCDRNGLTLPVHSYPHEGGICSVTGGYVHRGSIPALRGHYVYGDFCSGDIWSLRLVDGQATDVRAWPELDVGLVFSFAADARGETYVMGSGTVWRIVAG